MEPDVARPIATVVGPQVTKVFDGTINQMTIQPGVLTVDPGPKKKPKFQDQLKKGSDLLIQQ